MKPRKLLRTSPLLPPITAPRRSLCSTKSTNPFKVNTSRKTPRSAFGNHFLSQHCQNSISPTHLSGQHFRKKGGVTPYSHKKARGEVPTDRSPRAALVSLLFGGSRLAVLRGDSHAQELAIGRGRVVDRHRGSDFHVALYLRILIDHELHRLPVCAVDGERVALITDAGQFDAARLGLLLLQVFLRGVVA